MADKEASTSASASRACVAKVKRWAEFLSADPEDAATRRLESGIPLLGVQTPHHVPEFEATLVHDGPLQQQKWCTTLASWPAQTDAGSLASPSRVHQEIVSELHVRLKTHIAS